MPKDFIQRKDYDKLNEIFVKKTKEQEDLYKDKLLNEKISLPLASNFAWGDLDGINVTGKPSESLPDWVRQILLKAWNDAIKDFQ